MAVLLSWTNHAAQASPAAMPPVGQGYADSGASAENAGSGATRVQIPSLFFTPDEVNRIREALSAYDHHRTLPSAAPGKPDAPENKVEAEPKSDKYTYPQFFLESLVYHSPGDWIVWINGRKITSDTPQEGASLRTLAVDENKVRFAWLPPSMPLVNAVWDNSQGERNGDDDSVTVDKLAGKVEFTLQPNQTFSAYVLRVLEGKVKPVTVSTASMMDVPQGTDKMPASQGAAPGTTQDTKSGLDGLLNAYQQLGNRP